MTEEELPMICIGCGSSLRQMGLGQQRPYKEPVDAVIFVASGNFGSRLFDPMNGTQLIAHICDQCLLDKADRLLMYEPPYRQQGRYTRWEAGTDVDHACKAHDDAGVEGSPGDAPEGDHGV